MVAMLVIGVVVLFFMRQWAMAERARVIAQADTASDAMRDAAGMLAAAFRRDPA